MFRYSISPTKPLFQYNLHSFPWYSSSSCFLWFFIIYSKLITLCHDLTPPFHPVPSRPMLPYLTPAWRSSITSKPFDFSGTFCSNFCSSHYYIIRSILSPFLSFPSHYFYLSLFLVLIFPLYPCPSTFILSIPFHYPPSQFFQSAKLSNIL